MKIFSLSGNPIFEVAEANLQMANLRGVNLREAFFQTPTFRFDSGVWDVSFNGAILQIGCQSYPLEAWEAFSDDQIQAMDEKALTFWKTHKTFLLGLTRQLLKDRPYDQS